jgi:manganese transport protein
MSMLIIAAALFHTSGLTGVDTIEGAHAGFEQLLGGGGARCSSRSRCSPPAVELERRHVRGQVVMQGFIARASRSSCAARSRWRRR